MEIRSIGLFVFCFFLMDQQYASERSTSDNQLNTVS